jgi:predicted nucleotidyltransferase
MSSLTSPRLGAPYDEALHFAVSDLLTHYSPIAIVAAGSILRGQGGPTSDIDLYVLHHAPFRQRLQRRYNGVPFEIFINPPQQVRRYFEEEHAAARPITAHILTTGAVVLDCDPIVRTLREEAAVWLAKPPAPAADSMRWRRYAIADELDNASDIVDTDPACASLILHSAVSHLLEYAFLANNRHLPRQKAMIGALDDLDSHAASIARAFYAAGDVREQLPLATALAAHLTGATSFFEWDSAQLPVQ